ncbi:fumarylacetoacetate hydrolase family protein [Arenimonas caeni]|jgi:2-keto-4-pentenoate hydratase/2-oxohepta-3-ene-1,7-dioic acid hydratase in catechol pathway|uniref:Fumarylacetoacetate hydrolase n=1 Tax=Arenimonas caeni TaxID=2058085 RepID=A0A2P6MAK9_9GAMM|nr:fumarylacetoacetate hydrolase family protein [Arenimonas caeni]MDY0022115.1 fumarylacetoacetate hydrolase family protein [Arenimonas caeni]PRH83020.1 fumarylacetoacetate hydrolase [Arenimonas caeni]
MSQTVIPVPAPTLLPVRGGGAFPVRRIYCVGRNFADHAREMGASVDRGNPVFFMKPGDAVVAGGGAVPYPPGTQELHHEVELVVALGRDADGVVPVDGAGALVFGYGVGLDLTRRDLQAKAKAGGLPWDTAKGFDHSAPCSELVPAAQAGDLAARRLWLEVNGQPRQGAALGEMVFPVAEVIHALSKLFALKAGDLVFMGTPAGVAALAQGDRFHAGIEGLVELEGSIT